MCIRRLSVRLLPIATICLAAESLGAAEPRVIDFASGVTRLDAPIVLGPEDSGTILRGAADGSSVVSGARELKGLVFAPDGRGAFAAPCDEGPKDQLFVDGVRYDMARFPNKVDGKNVYGTWSLDESGAYAPERDALLPGRVAKWAHPETGWLHAMHDALWGDMHWKIDGAGEDGRLKLTGGWQNNRSSAPHKVFRYVENIREELDSPGEWFYDATERKLYVIPLPGVDLSKARIESVELRSLVVVRGKEGRPVRGIVVENLRFTGAARTFMENKEPLLRSDWTLCREAAVTFENAEDCRIVNCGFRSLGGNAVLVDGHAKNVSVVDSTFEDIGASGVIFAGRPDCVRSPLFNYSAAYDASKMDMETRGPKSESYPRDCRVESCRFLLTGRDEKQTAAVQITMAARISVLKCFIRRTPRAAINIGDGCFGGHLIEGCDVAETVLETGDHGAFNSWGRDRYWQPGIENFEQEVAKNPALPFLDAVEPTVIRGNRWRCDHGWDVDLDDGSSNYIIEDNDFLSGGLKLREGYRRVVRNNRARSNTLHRHCWPARCGDVVVSNVFARPFSDIWLRCAEGDATIRDNIILSGERREAKPAFGWEGGRVREFDGPLEFSAFGVTPETVGIVVIEPPSGTPFLSGDLIPEATRETLPEIPLKGGVDVVRAQRRIVLRDSREEDIHVQSSLFYGPRRKGNAQSFDLYLPSGSIADWKCAPFLLFLHGGAWCAGGRGQDAWLLRKMAERGFACASMDYALSRVGGGGASFDDMLRDIDTMVSHVASERRRLGIAGQQPIAIGGSSAGGHLALLYAYDEANSSVLGLGLRHEIPIGCVVSDCGPTDLASREFEIAGRAGFKSGEVERTKWFSALSGGAAEAEDREVIRRRLVKYSPAALVCPKTPPTVAIYCSTHTVRGTTVKTDGIVAEQNYHALTNALSSSGVEYSAKLMRHPHCQALAREPRLVDWLCERVGHMLGVSEVQKGETRWKSGK